jgi:hypothetical protein
MPESPHPSRYRGPAALDPPEHVARIFDRFYKWVRAARAMPEASALDYPSLSVLSRPKAE